MIARIATAIVLLGLTACSPTAQLPLATPIPTATLVPLRSTQIKPDAYAGAAMFSDEEFKAMRLKVVNLDDLARYPLPGVTLAPRTRVQVMNITTMKLGSGAGQGIVEMDFEQVRVVDGPANGRAGWVSAATLAP